MTTGLTTVAVTVPGEPVPWAPKKTNFKTGNRFIPGRQVEAIGRILDAVERANLEPFGADALLRLNCMFSVRRPKGHWGTGRNADSLKPSAPMFPAGRPDLSNLVKWVEDGLVLAGLFPDDDQVIYIEAWKRYTAIRGEQPRSVVRIEVVPWPG